MTDFKNGKITFSAPVEPEAVATKKADLPRRDVGVPFLNRETEGPILTPRGPSPIKIPDGPPRP